MAAPYQTEINYTIYRGDTFEAAITLDFVDGNGDPLPVDLTGLEYLAQLRSGSTLIGAFEVTGNVTGSTLEITLSIDAVNTALLPIKTLDWDLQITFSDGTVKTYCYGTATVLKDKSYA